MDIGLGEFLLIVIVSLIVFGPQKLPEVAGALGRALYEFRRASADITATFLGAQVVEPAPPAAPLPSGRPCAACGAFVRSEHRFCTVCGTDQETWMRPSTPGGHVPHDPADGDQHPVGGPTAAANGNPAVASLAPLVARDAPAEVGGAVPFTTGSRHGDD